MEMERRPFRPFAAWALLIALSWALLQVLMRQSVGLNRGTGSFFAPLVALGVVAGAAWLQARLLRRWRVSAGAWLLATAVGALLGLLLGLRWLVADLYMVPGVTPAGAWLTAFPRLAARYAAQAHAGGGLPHYLELDGLYAGLTFGLALGAAQSVALWRAGWRALAWIPAGAAAWGVGLFAAQLLRFLVVGPLGWETAVSLPQFAAVSAAGGLLIGLTAALPLLWPLAAPSIPDLNRA